MLYKTTLERKVNFFLGKGIENDIDNNLEKLKSFLHFLAMVVKGDDGERREVHRVFLENDSDFITHDESYRASIDGITNLCTFCETASFLKFSVELSDFLLSDVSFREKYKYSKQSSIVLLNDDDFNDKKISLRDAGLLVFSVKDIVENDGWKLYKKCFQKMKTVRHSEFKIEQKKNFNFFSDYSHPFKNFYIYDPYLSLADFKILLILLIKQFPGKEKVFHLKFPLFSGKYSKKKPLFAPKEVDILKKLQLVTTFNHNEVSQKKNMSDQLNFLVNKLKELREYFLELKTNFPQCEFHINCPISQPKNRNFTHIFGFKVGFEYPDSKLEHHRYIFTDHVFFRLEKGLSIDPANYYESSFNFFRGEVPFNYVNGRQEVVGKMESLDEEEHIFGVKNDVCVVEEFFFSC